MAGMPGAVGTARPLTPSGGTAKTLVLVGLIFDIIFAIVGIVAGISAAVAILASGTPYAGFALFPTLIGGLLLVAILFLVYTFSYNRIKQGNYQGARAATLIWAILSLISIIGILPGILYLIAYVKLGDAIREQQQPPYAQAAWGQPQPMYAAAPGAAPAYAAPGAAPAAATPPTTPMCPRCGQPATYIAQYGRWYCPRDQTYL